MSQLGALVWLKWKLFRNSLRSRRAVTGRVASALVTLAGLAVSLVVAAVLGAAAYAFASPAARENPGLSKVGVSAYVFFLFALSFVYLMWAVVPLGLEGGNRFEPRRLLLYPISLRKLFAVDLISELTNLSAIFAVPIVLAIGIGAGLAQGGVGRALLAAALAVAFGVALSKLFSTFVGALMRDRRTRGETVLALLGVVVGLSGVLLGQVIERFAPQAARYEGALRDLRWTPPGAFASALTAGLREGGTGEYASAVATLAAYTAACVAFTYWIARRTALGIGGACKGKAGKAAAAGAGAVYAGWQFPLMSPQLSAIVEKELRYAARNAPLRAVAMMAVALTVVMKLASGRGSLGSLLPSASAYTEGMQMSYGVLYVFLMTSAISTNLFGYDGAGMRALVLAPIDRRLILVGKNVAITLVIALMGVAAVAVNALAFGDVSWQALLTVALSSITFAALFALGGNWLSIRFPKRVEFGRRMNRTGVAGLLLIPFMIALAAPLAVAALAAYASQSLVVKYVILALFALASVAAYVLLVGVQARTLAGREREIMEAVTGRDDDAGQVLG